LPRKRKALLAAVAILALNLVSLAKTHKLNGKIVAYDVMKHASKDATFRQNQEAVVLETDSPKQRDKYVKVVFTSFGTTQIEQKYFDGTLPLKVDVFRDHSCDEKEPVFVSQVSFEHIAGTYLLTDAFKNHPPVKIKNLECYAAIYKKK
jgi:hypothetical protein